MVSEWEPERRWQPTKILDVGNILISDGVPEDERRLVVVEVAVEKVVGKSTTIDRSDSSVHEVTRSYNNNKIFFQYVGSSTILRLLVSTFILQCIQWSSWDDPVVPVEAEWSWIRHVFDGGVPSSSCCRSLRFILWLRQWTLLLRTRYDPGSASPSLSLFLSPTLRYPLFSCTIILS